MLLRSGKSVNHCLKSSVLRSQVLDDTRSSWPVEDGAHSGWSVPALKSQRKQWFHIFSRSCNMTVVTTAASVSERGDES